MNRLTITLAALGAFILLISPTAASAQDCGWNCRTCGGSANKYEGYDYNPGGPYDMTCPNHGEMDHCEISLCQFAAVGLASLSGTEVAEIIAAATPGEIPLVVAGFGDRMVFNHERGLVLVVGAGCDPDAPSDMVQLSAEQAAAMQRLRVRTMESFFNDWESR